MQLVNLKRLMAPDAPTQAAAPAEEQFLLQEDGFNLLLEDGSRIKLERSS